MIHAKRTRCLLLLTATLTACGGDLAPSAGPSKGAGPQAGAGPAQDVILVTLDTTRADHLGVYGDDKADTTWLDALAERGTRFAHAYAVQPLTIPAHSSIMTGLYPFHHGVRSNGDAVLDERFDTLAERLKAAGYQTGASVAAFVTTRQWGFAQGFDSYADDLGVQAGHHGSTWHEERPANAVVDDALAFVQQAQADKPMFLWVHLYDAHFPYEPPPEYHERWHEDGYRGELAWVDDQLERLADGVKAAGRDPMWVVVGDHGEGLGDHRELNHGLYTYDATQHVPWIIAGPGVPQAVIDEPVSAVDVTPTILSLLGRPVPDDLDGKAQPGAVRPIYTEAYQLAERFSYAPHVTVVDGTHKLIDKPKPELYDLAADPGELTNLADQQPDEVKRMRALLADIGATWPTKSATALDPESVARLEALGYLSGNDYDDVDFSTLPDPLDHQPVINRSQQVELMIVKGELDKAIAQLRVVVAAEPGLTQPAMRLAGLLVRTKKPLDALDVVEAVLVNNPEDAWVIYRAAVLVGQTGNHERALSLAERALELDPDNTGVAEVIASAMANLGRPDDAVAFATEFISRVPDAPGVAAVPAIILFDKGQLAEAEPWLRRALKTESPRGGIAPRLATLAMRAGKLEDAEKLLQRELKNHPDSVRARGQLVGVLLARKDRPAVKVQLDVLLATPLRKDAPSAARYERARWLHTRSGILFDAGDLVAARADVEAGQLLLPDDADLMLMLANIQRKEGDLETAKATKVKADALNKQRLETLRQEREKAASAGGPSGAGAVVGAPTGH